jgi:hypothetical protein
MTLTEAASFSKKAIKLVLVAVVLIMVGWIVLRIINPPIDVPNEYLEPNNMCGVIDELSLNSLEVDTPNTDFDIETASGAIPEIAEVVNVYQYANPGHSLWALEEAQMKAEALEFEPGLYTRTGSTIYQWRNTETHQTLTVDTSNQNFTLTTDFQTDDINTYAESLPNESDAKEFALEFLQQTGLLTQDYSNGYQEVIPVQITANGEFREAESIADADLVRVDLFRYKDIITIAVDESDSTGIGSTLQEQLDQQDTEYVETNGEEIEVKTYQTKVFTNSPILGNISVYLGGDEYQTEANVFAINYSDWIIDDNPCGTYRLITPQAAVTKVQDGDGYLVHLLEEGGDRLVPYEEKTIKALTVYNVDLAYLDLSEEQNYLQPIYYITGEAEFSNGVFGEFYYYVPAIDYDAIPENAGEIDTTEDQ